MTGAASAAVLRLVRLRGLAALTLCGLLAAGGCSTETTGTVDYGVEPGAAAPTTGEDSGAAYVVLSCRQIAREQAALAAAMPPTAGPQGGDIGLRRHSAALERLAAIKGCTTRTGQLVGASPSDDRR